MESRLVLKELSRYKIGTLSDIIYRNALLHSGRQAFVYRSQRVTFGEFNARVNSLIHALQSMGVNKGDVIGVLSWNCMEYADVYGTAMKGGFIISPFNVRLQTDELYYLINYSEANTLFVGPEFVEIINSMRPRLTKVRNYISLEGPSPNMICHHDLLADYPKQEPDVQVEEDDPLCILYTSGTTGVPRGALYTHRCAIEDARTRTIETAIEAENRNILILPLFHIGAADALRVYFYVGATSIIMRDFDPAVTLQTIQEEEATDIQIVPTHLAAIFALPDIEKYDLSSLKRIYYVGSPMPLELLKSGIKAFGPVFCQWYGQTEAGPNICLLHRYQHKSVDGPTEEQKILVSAGQPAIGVQVRIVDDSGKDIGSGEIGEIIVRSKGIMVEYWHKPDDTGTAMADGWLRTGDMGYYDEKGYIYLVDRKHDVIVSGGENIYSREVEEILHQHPAIMEAVVIGISDPYWVERVHAVVVVKEGATLNSDEVISFCKKRIARYKAPKSVEFVDSLPKSPTGKILKKELRKKHGAEKGLYP